MASPWKFLARLTLRRRDRTEQKDAPTDGAAAKEVEAREPVAPEAGMRPQPIDGPAEEDTLRADQASGGLSVPKPAETGGEEIDDRKNAGLVTAPDPALPAVTAVPIGDGPSVPSPFKKPVGKQTRRRTFKVVKSVAVLPQPVRSAPSFTDEVQGLDEEIGLLRRQLSRKLQLQNAQLKKMLERFER